jgi:hypothetical protein
VTASEFDRLAGESLAGRWLSESLARRRCCPGQSPAAARASGSLRARPGGLSESAGRVRVPGHWARLRQAPDSESESESPDAAQPEAAASNHVHLVTHSESESVKFRTMITEEVTAT